jgi:hypothetical protein
MGQVLLFLSLGRLIWIRIRKLRYFIFGVVEILFCVAVF